MAERLIDVLHSVEGATVPASWCARLAFMIRNPGEPPGDLTQLLPVLDAIAAENARRRTRISAQVSAAVSDVAPDAETAASSDPVQWLSTGAAAVALGLTDRRVRQLARHSARAARRSGRRWEIDVAAMRSERERIDG